MDTDDKSLELDVSQLRKLTEQAIQRGKEKEAKHLAGILAEQERTVKLHHLLASKILAQLPNKCEKEATQGRSHVIAMGLKHGRDFTYSREPEVFKLDSMPSNRLKGPGEIVWNQLQISGLNPTIEYWHDGMGVHSGYNIVVHW